MFTKSLVKILRVKLRAFGVMASCYYQGKALEWPQLWTGQDSADAIVLRNQRALYLKEVDIVGNHCCCQMGMHLLTCLQNKMQLSSLVLRYYLPWFVNTSFQCNPIRSSFEKNWTTLSDSATVASNLLHKHGENIFSAINLNILFSEHSGVSLALMMILFVNQALHTNTQ